MKAPRPSLIALSIKVHETILVSEKIFIGITILLITSSHSLSFSIREIAELREILSTSVGDKVSGLTEEDLVEFGTAMLQTTAIVLKAKYHSSNQ